MLGVLKLRNPNYRCGFFVGPSTLPLHPALMASARRSSSWWSWRTNSIVQKDFHDLCKLFTHTCMQQIAWHPQQATCTGNSHQATDNELPPLQVIHAYMHTAYSMASTTGNRHQATEDTGMHTYMHAHTCTQTSGPWL